MRQFSDEGTVVLPILIEECAIPELLRDRVYADFRADYTAGLTALLKVFDHETTSAAEANTNSRTLSAAPVSSCVSLLSELRLADLRRRMTKRMDRVEIGTIWFDTFEQKMDDTMVNREKVECVIELLERARNRGSLETVVRNVCAEREDLAKPI